MINGEKIKVLLKPREDQIKIYGEWVEIEIQSLAINFSCSLDWWNAEYKEPTTKNDLGVDKLLSDCEKMSFDIEIFNKPLKVVALDAVKNIVKDLSSVTPQEPRWIPVSERLPDIHNYSEHYLVTLKNGEVHRAMCTEMNGEHWWNYNLDDVIAWMPLPQPYREVKK